MFEPLHWIDPAQYHPVKKDVSVIDNVATMCVHPVCLRMLKGLNVERFE